MRLYFKNGNGYYEGDIRGGNVPTGFGTIYYNGELTFEGFFLEGKRHGYGKEYQGNVLLYRGEWFDNLRHGYGYARYANVTYIGCFVKGYPYGFGVFFYDNGDIFVGECKDGRMHGKGTYLHANKKTRLEGWWKDDQMNGVFFYINEKGDIEKRIYDHNVQTFSASISLADRMLNDLSGVYGCFEKNNKMYYGKYKPYKIGSQYIKVLEGMVLTYDSPDSWEIATYASDTKDGEAVYFEKGLIERFGRWFAMDGQARGFSLEYEYNEVTGQLHSGKQDSRVPGFQYVSNESLYVGEMRYSVPDGQGILYSFESNTVSTVFMQYKQIESKTDLFTTHDIFEYCYTLSKTCYPGFDIDASQEKFVAGPASFSFEAGKKHLDPDKCLFFDRINRTISFKDSQGSCGYVSTLFGDRHYFVHEAANSADCIIGTDGDCSQKHVRSGKRYVMKRQNECLHKFVYDSEDEETGEKEQWLFEANGACLFLKKDHTNDTISWKNLAYNGCTRDGYPFGNGRMIFPEFGYVEGQWRGLYDCDNATFFSYSTQKAENVTVNHSTILFPDGRIFKYHKDM